MTEDEWYADLDLRYSKTGYTGKEWKKLTLESATLNDEGICWPPHTASMFDFHSALMGLFMKGFIKRKNCRFDEPILPYLITDLGRSELSKLQQST